MVDFQKLLREMPVKLEQLQLLHEIGMKIVPLDATGKPAITWTDIYEHGWESFDKIRRIQSKFMGVGTTFGYNSMHQKYLNCLDIDSEKVLDTIRAMKNPMSDRPDDYSILLSCNDHTFMTKTRKRYGYHVYWFSTKQNPPVLAQDCYDGCVFEIKTGKDMTTLPPSVHRTDPRFRYESIGASKIATNDALYGLFMEELKQYLKPKKVSVPKAEQQKWKTENWEEAFESVQPWGLTLDDADEIYKILQPIYDSGNRNVIMMGLSGMFRKFNATYDTAVATMELLCDALKDGEKQSRLWTLKNTYNLDRLTDRIGGYRMIAEVNQHAAKSLLILLKERSNLFGADASASESKTEVDQPPV